MVAVDDDARGENRGRVGEVPADDAGEVVAVVFMRAILLRSGVEGLAVDVDIGVIVEGTAAEGVKGEARGIRYVPRFRCADGS